MRDILKRIFIGVAIGMALFFLKTEVFALSWDLEVKQQITIFNTTPVTCSWSTPTNAGQAVCRKDFTSSYTNSNGYNFMVIPFTLAYSQWGLTPGEASNAYSSFRAVLRSNTTWSTCEIQNNFLVCPLIKGLTYTGIQIYTTSVVDSILYEVNFNNTADMYNFPTNASSAIQQQTDDILDSDSPADATYNNDYSTTDYDTAESNMNQNLDTDVSSFIFNPAQWVNAFNWIWQTLTSFVQVNGKVFATITSFLTFSFVGLVIGRS